jgi:hypothetical protein
MLNYNEQVKQNNIINKNSYNESNELMNNVHEYCSGRQLCREGGSHVVKEIALWLRTKCLIVCVYFIHYIYFGTKI